MTCDRRAPSSPDEFRGGVAPLLAALEREREREGERELQDSDCVLCSKLEVVGGSSR